MFAHLAQGGWIMVPLVACSVAAVSILLERILTLRAAGREATWAREEAEPLAARGSREELAALAEEADAGPHARLLHAAALDDEELPPGGIEEALRQAGESASRDLDRFFPTLASIATAAPLLGLLGTVLGLIEVFGRIRTEAATDLSILERAAGGLSQALITTAAGLAVGIPCAIAYTLLSASRDRVRGELEGLARTLLATRASPQATPPAESFA